MTTATTSPEAARRNVLARFGASNVLIVLALLILAVVVFCALSGDLLAPIDPAKQSLRGRLVGPGTEVRGTLHWLGTDAIGRDILSLLVAGAQPALFVSLMSVLIGASFGTLLGLLSGYVGGRAKGWLLYGTNLQLSFPFFLLAVTIVGILRPSMPLVIFVIALGTWVPFARIALSETMQIRELEYIEAVRVMRGSQLRIILRHILPNILPNLLVLFTFAMGNAIVLESGLSFVGLGVPSQTPTWGRMLSEGRDYMQSAWWLTLFPGVAIFLLVLSINILGERARDLLDPKMMGR